MLRRLGADAVEVRKPEQLDGLDGLVVPGGESTAIMRLIRLYGLEEAIRASRGPVFGTCAGMILLDRKHLGLVDVEVGATPTGARSRASRPTSSSRATSEPLRGVFIRAPRVARAGPDVEVLAELDGEPVLLRDGRFLVASFHPELTDDTRVHERFLELVREETGCPGIASGRRSSTRRARPTRSAASSSRSCRARSSWRRREGGPDPAANLALQNAIEKARAYSMPKDNIERAIARGSGADADAQRVRDDRLRGLRAGGVAVLVEALTDNRNRTAAEVRHAFAKHDGNLGTSGAVAWLFERRAVVLVPADGVDEDELMLAAADGRRGRRRRATARASRCSLRPRRWPACGDAIEAAGFTIESAELTMVPKTTVAVEDEAAAQQARPADGRARGERRRPGRLRELRHPRARARAGRGVIR